MPAHNSKQVLAQLLKILVLPQVAGAVMIHAGVEINIPFTKCDVASFHSFHHKMGDSHYGVWGMVDYLFGTCVDFDRLDAKKQ